MTFRLHKSWRREIPSAHENRLVVIPAIAQRPISNTAIFMSLLFQPSEKMMNKFQTRQNYPQSKVVSLKVLSFQKYKPPLRLE